MSIIKYMYKVYNQIIIFHIYCIWSNNSRGYYAKFEIEGGLLLLLKSSLIEIAEFCLCDFNWEQMKVINGH